LKSAYQFKAFHTEINHADFDYLFHFRACPAWCPSLTIVSFESTQRLENDFRACLR